MTTMDWHLLIGVRERQKTAALALVVHERCALQAAKDQARMADAQWQHQLQAKTAHWQATKAALAGGGFKSAQLREAATGSRALDSHIAQTGRAAAEARTQVLQQEARLGARLGELRSAEGELLKARQMQDRQRAQQLRTGELRQEDAAEDVATQKWLRRRPSVTR